MRPGPLRGPAVELTFAAVDPLDMHSDRDRGLVVFDVMAAKLAAIDVGRARRLAVHTPSVEQMFVRWKSDGPEWALYSKMAMTMPIRTPIAIATQSDTCTTMPQFPLSAWFRHARGRCSLRRAGGRTHHRDATAGGRW